MNKSFVLKVSAIWLLMVFLNYWGVHFVAPFLVNTWKRAFASSLATKTTKNEISFSLEERPFYKMLFDGRNKNFVKDHKKESERKISICVAGEVNYPGQFQLSAGSSVIAGIWAAGGVNRNGSLRKIKILKDDNSCQEVDLYNFLNSKSKTEAKLALEDGDTVVVPEVGILVKVCGKVRRPGVYELDNLERSLGWLLKTCSIKNLENKNYKIDLYRYQDGLYKNIISQKIDKSILETDLSGVLLEDKDTIEILVDSGSSPDSVELCGHFRYPGKVVLKSRTYLSEMVTKENLMYGYVENYAEVLRRNESKKEYEVLSFSPKALLAGDKRAELQLKHGDRIMVFSQALLTREAKVAIEGEIENSGKYAWKEGLRVADLVKDAGGLKPGAGKTAKIERNTIENGKLKQKTLIVNLEKALGRDLRYNLRLQPFDLLVCMKQ